MTTRQISQSGGIQALALPTSVSEFTGSIPMVPVLVGAVIGYFLIRKKPIIGTMIGAVVGYFVGK